MWRDRFRSSSEQAKAVEVSVISQARATRFELDAFVSFVIGQGKHDGQCVNVSESGLLAKFDEPPELWTDGQLSLEAGDHYLGIHARVARIQGNEVGFAFSIQNDNDKAAINILIESVSAKGRQTDAS